MNKAYYHDMRIKYTPKRLKIIFVCESPPESDKYFYKEEGSVGEPLFSSMMKLLNLKPSTKREGLELFAQAGYLLVDATYCPVNHLTNTKRNAVILQSFDELVSDLTTLIGTSSAELILIKANVCRLLEARLLNLDFKVRNNGIVIPFPSTGQQSKFFQAIRKVLDGANI